MIRRLIVPVHRWIGLAMLVFLFIAAVTGSLLAYNSELERLISPQLFAKPKPAEARLSLATLAERAAPLVPHGRLVHIYFSQSDQVTANFVARQDPLTGKPYNLGFTEFYVDPWTGAELGHRTRGDLSEGLVNLMPFIYNLHWTLVLGDFGMWVMGIVAILWTLDCFVGFYLTLPIALEAFFRRWKPAWLIKRHAGAVRLNFDLHRAFALWLWPLLLILGWSSVMMNIRPVYEWVTRAVFDYRSQGDDFAMPSLHRRDTPRLDWQAAESIGRQLMAKEASKFDFKVIEPLGMGYRARSGFYIYEVRSSRDVFERAPKGGDTFVEFDGDTGELVQLFRPTGEHTGNTLESWLYALHMARVFGRPYQILVCVAGIGIATMSVTGFYIWLVKRRGRRTVLNRRRILGRPGSVAASGHEERTQC